MRDFWKHRMTLIGAIVLGEKCVFANKFEFVKEICMQFLQFTIFGFEGAIFMETLNFLNEILIGIYGGKRSQKFIGELQGYIITKYMQKAQDPRL